MVRNFVPTPLPADVKERILANAQRAPSAGFSQGWAFLVLDGPEQTRGYWETVGPERPAAFQWPGLFNAPLLVVCWSNQAAYVDRYAEPDKGWTDRDPARWSAPFWDIDTGMAAMLMLLTAVDAGLGALFFRVPPAKMQRLRTRYGIPEGLHPIGTLAIGYPAPTDRPSPSLQRGRRAAAEVVHRGHW